MKTYFSFAVADSMLPDNCVVKKSTVSISDVRELLQDSQELYSCLNKSHMATVEAMKTRFGLSVAVPEFPPQVSLESGDRLVVMSVRGLPRLTESRHYTAAEIAAADFKFSLYEIL